MRRKLVQQLLVDCLDGDYDYILAYGKFLKVRAHLKQIRIFEGDFRPWRLALIGAIALPLNIYAYGPTTCDPEPQILKMWLMAVGTTISLYKLLP